MISKPRDHACERQSTFIQASTPHLPTSHYASSYASALRRLSSCHVLLQAARVVRVSTTLMNHAFHFSQTNNADNGHNLKLKLSTIVSITFFFENNSNLKLLKFFVKICSEVQVENLS